MSSINLNVGASAFEQLRAINTMAQSTSGSISGRIGLINQANGQPRVIKFNTHLGERLFGAAKTVDMQASCDALRERICGLLDTLAEEGKISAELCEKLKASVNNGKSKKLLDRSIVANVIKDVETAANTNRKEGARLVSLHGSEYDMYDRVSTDRQTDFETVRSGGEVKPRTITVEKKAPDSARFGKTPEEIKKSIRYKDNLKQPSEEVLNKNGFYANHKVVAPSLVNDLKRVEFDDNLKEELKDVDINLQTQKDFKDRIEDVDDTRHMTTKENFEDFFEVVQGGTADVVKEIKEREKDNQNLHIAAQIFADDTLFLCGIDGAWTSQEEALAYASNSKPFQKLIADGKVELCNVSKNPDNPSWRWKYVDGDGALSAVDSYIFKGQLDRDGDLHKLDKPIDLDWDFAAMPSLRTDSSYRDARGNLEYLCRCRGIPTSPLTPQLQNAMKFIQTFLDKGGKALGGDNDGKNVLVKEAMKLLMFGGDNDGFKIFSDNPEQEVQKLVDLVKSDKHKKKGSDGMSLLDKANANYKSTLLKVVSGWVATARERGVTHFIGGAAGLGVFNNDPEVAAEVLAEAFAKHGGDMKFVFADFVSTNGTTRKTDLANLDKFKTQFAARFKEIRAQQQQTGNVGNAGAVPPPSENVAGAQPRQSVKDAVNAVGIPPPPPLPNVSNLNSAGSVNNLAKPQSNTVEQRKVNGEPSKPKETKKTDRKPVQPGVKEKPEVRVADDKFAKVMEDFDLKDVDRETVYAKTADAAETVSDNIKKILDGGQTTEVKIASLETYLNGLYAMLFEGPKGDNGDDNAQNAMRGHLDKLKDVAGKLSSQTTLQQGIGDLRNLLDDATKYWSNRPLSPIQGGQATYREFATSLVVGLNS